jgi:ribosomal protein S18 acetylase RimI-like enzyme
MDEIVIRLANESDLPSLGRLGALLLETHYRFDEKRFMAPLPNSSEGYEWFLRSQLKEKDVVVFVAERAGAIVGYVYAGLEPTSWKELRNMSGFIHDVAVEDSSRRMGIASSLVKAAIEWLQAHGAPRVMLWTAERNPAAQDLFSRLGFRRTMIEMTRELQESMRDQFASFWYSAFASTRTGRSASASFRIAKKSS